MTGGALSETAPAITAFAATLTGTAQSVPAAVGAWTLNDPVGDGVAYHVTVGASVPTIGGTALTTAELTSMGSTFLSLTATTPTATTGNPAPQSTHPVAAATQSLNATTAATIVSAAANTGAGSWDYAADSGVTKNLSVVIPGDVSAGTYSDTLTYTIASGA